MQPSTFIIQYNRYKGADPIFKLSQWSYRVQIWHAQRKQSELESILSNLFVILNILASRRGWTFLGWKFLRFWRKNVVPSGQRDRERECMEWNSEMMQKSLFLMCNLIFGIEINWNLHFHSLPLLPPTKLIQK